MKDKIIQNLKSALKDSIKLNESLISTLDSYSQSQFEIYMMHLRCALKGSTQDLIKAESENKKPRTIADNYPAGFIGR